MKLSQRARMSLLVLITGCFLCGNAFAADTIKVGVLHSLSGTYGHQ